MPRRRGDEIDWEAEETLVKARARVLRRMKPHEVTVEMWLSAHHLLFPDERSERTRRVEMSMLRGLRKAHGKVKMMEFTPMQAQAWALKHPGHVRYLKRAWRKAVLMQCAPMNVWNVVELPRAKGERRRPPTADELNRSLIACRAFAEGRDPWWRLFGLMIEVAAYTGAREGGLIRLTRPDVDLEARRATVTEKGDKTRQVVLCGPSLQAMSAASTFEWPWCECAATLVNGSACTQCGKLALFQRYPNRPSKPERHSPLVRAHIFRWKDGTLLTADRVQKAWREVQGDFPHPFHSLRHYAATWLAAQGVDPLDIAVQLGHMDREGRPYERLVKRVYDHPDPNVALERVAERVA